jgi:tRNA(fMet)-specific endonuclease VapC
MDKKICLDTDICIEFVKGNKDFYSFFEIDYVPYVTSITVFELLLRKTNLDKMEFLLSKVNILNFDEISARESSHIYKELEKSGDLIEFRDIFIALTCIINNCTLLTLNKKHFSRIKNLKLL